MTYNKIDLSWLPQAKTESHQSPSEEVYSAWKDIREKTGFKTYTEIGFNAGHSASILMSLFDDISVISYDICVHPETIENAEIVKKKFGDRFTFIPYNSYYLRRDYIGGMIDIEETDLIFIDGSHRSFFVKSDLELSKLVGYKYAIFDDSDMGSVRKHIVANYSNEKIIKDYWYPPWSIKNNYPADYKISMTLIDNT